MTDADCPVYIKDMDNANNDRAARIPRNAIRVWQSNETIARLMGAELTASLRQCIHYGEWRSATLVHPKDWP